MSADIDLTDRASYQYWSQEKLRFSDTGMIGHVNNVAFAALIESGRVAFTRSGVIDGLPRGTLIVMRRLELDYRAELHWPADIDVGSRLWHVGRTSFAIANGVFHDTICAATSITTLVLIDRTTRRPAAIPGEIRARLVEALPH